MYPSRRLGVLVVASLLGLIIPAAISPYALGQVTDPAAKATIAAAFISLFGIVFGAVYSEISAYYKDRALGMEKKWELVFPLMRDYYNPWIQGAKYFSGFLRELKVLAKSEEISPDAAARAMFYQVYFYSRRLKFSLEAGGRPILADDEDEEKVLNAYRSIELSLQWAGKDTRSRVARLQKAFLDREKYEPYLSNEFIADAIDPKNIETVKDCERLKEWLTIDHMNKTAQALEEFESHFKQGINRMYRGWVS